MKKCPNCGKTKKEFIDNICKDCYRDSHSLVEGFKNIIIEKCPLCDAYRYKRRFLKNALNQVIKDYIIFDKNTRISSVTTELERGNANITIKGTLLDEELTEEYTVPMKLIKATCSRCGKKGTQYFEGILQIRSKLHENIELAFDYIQKELKKADKKGIYCNKRIKLKNGVDFVLTDKNYVKELAKKVFDEFGFEMKVNAQLFSRNKMTSKDIFRVNAVVQLPDFKKEDVLKIEEMLLKVISVRGKRLHAYDLDKNKKVKVDLKNYKIIATEEDYFETEVVQDMPIVKVLHPTNFQAVELQNSASLKVGEKVRVLVIGDKVWLNI